MPETPSSNTSAPWPAVIPISQLNRLARERLESAFPLCWVAGEISNLTLAASGHAYFSLKDATAQVRCVMFRSRVQLLGWRLANGQHIEARVLVTLYEARGEFQLTVEAARRAGIGSLYEQFLRLKEKLEREGLFAADTKRPLPGFPRRIGIVTSPQAAALRDVLTTLRRRAPHIDIALYPTPVQGDGAAQQIASVIRLAGERAECDLLIVCRGGGNIEDLWAFNDEGVARAIRACPIPTVSGIGHETDFTIADFAADQRAATPTAAAELAAPERTALLGRLDDLHATLQRQIARRFEGLAQQLDWLAHRLQHPEQQLARQREALLNLRRRLDASLAQAGARGRSALAGLTRRLLLARPDTARHARPIGNFAPQLHGAGRLILRDKANQLAQLAGALAHLNPEGVLARGYSIVTDARGRIVRNADALELSEQILVNFHQGSAGAILTSIDRNARIALPAPRVKPD